MTDISEIDVCELLPQQRPFVMIGRMTHFDDEETVTETAVTPDNIFVDGARLSAPGLIENIAQSCAARLGYINKYILKKPVKVGVIGAIRDMTIHRCPDVGETLTTTIRMVEEIFGMSLVRAVIAVDKEIIVEGEMKIAVPRDPSDTE